MLLRSFFSRASKKGHYVAVMVSQHDELAAAAPLSMAGPECWNGHMQAGGALQTASSQLARIQSLCASQITTQAPVSAVNTPVMDWAFGGRRRSIFSAATVKALPDGAALRQQRSLHSLRQLPGYMLMVALALHKRMAGCMLMKAWRRMK